MVIKEIKGGIERREEDDGLSLLYDVETDRVHVLNDTGSWVWERISTGMSLQDVLTQVQTQFNLADKQMSEVAEQVVDYLIGLHRNELITVEVGGLELTEQS